MDNLFKPGDILRYSNLSNSDLYLILEYDNGHGYKYVDITYFLEKNILHSGTYRFNNKYTRYTPQ